MRMLVEVVRDEILSEISYFIQNIDTIYWYAPYVLISEQSRRQKTNVIIIFISDRIRRPGGRPRQRADADAGQGTANDTQVGGRGRCALHTPTHRLVSRGLLLVLLSVNLTMHLNATNLIT